MTPLFTKKASPMLIRIFSMIIAVAFLPLLIVGMYQSIQLITRATGTVASIKVDTENSMETIQTSFYHAFAQGGEEANDMIAPILAETKALSPTLIRIDHIYDHYDVVRKDGGSVSMHFEKLDRMVETILASGAKPVFSLSYMPSAIARDGVVINPPDDWNDWAVVVQKTIEHYSGKNGKNLSNIYYEVWNEPDLAQFGAWKMGGDKNYLTLYQHASLGASRASNVNNFFLGGPSTTGLYRNWILGLAKSGYRVDFFSWHSYLSDPKKFGSDQKNIFTWLTRLTNNPILATKPTLITEFGFSGNKSTNYQTRYAAAYTVSVIRQLISGGPTHLFSFELKDGPGQEDGSGWGLLTHETNGKKKKPRYFVYSFVDQMKGQRLNVQGEGTWVTGFASKEGNTIKLLLVNFDANGNHTENVPVAFTSLANGTYTYKEVWLFDPGTKNPPATHTVTDGKLEKKVYMPGQSVVRIEITKQ